MRGTELTSAGYEPQVQAMALVIACACSLVFQLVEPLLEMRSVSAELAEEIVRRAELAREIVSRGAFAIHSTWMPRVLAAQTSRASGCTSASNDRAPPTLRELGARSRVVAHFRYDVLCVLTGYLDPFVTERLRDRLACRPSDSTNGQAFRSSSQDAHPSIALVIALQGDMHVPLSRVRLQEIEDEQARPLLACPHLHPHSATSVARGGLAERHPGEIPGRTVFHSGQAAARDATPRSTVSSSRRRTGARTCGARALSGSAAAGVQRYEPNPPDASTATVTASTIPSDPTNTLATPTRRSRSRGVGMGRMRWRGLPSDSISLAHRRALSLA